MTELDRETNAAIEALARLIERNEDASPEVTAREQMLWLREHGWRPTEARAPSAVVLVTDGERGPSEETRALMEAAKARSAEATARLRPDLQDGAA